MASPAAPPGSSEKQRSGTHTVEAPARVREKFLGREGESIGEETVESRPTPDSPPPTPSPPKEAPWGT